MAGYFFLLDYDMSEENTIDEEVVVIELPETGSGKEKTFISMSNSFRDVESRILLILC